MTVETVLPLGLQGSCSFLPLPVERLQAEVEQVAGGSRLPSAGVLSILNVETGDC
jgi:hypothetical protein